MFSLILSVVLLAVYAGISESHASQINGRIYGGEEVSSDENYLVYLSAIDCGCAILSEEWMLTPSVCLYINGWKSGQTIDIPELGKLTAIYEGDLALIKVINKYKNAIEEETFPKELAKNLQTKNVQTASL